MSDDIVTKLRWVMSDDIVTKLRWVSDAKEWVKLRDWTIITSEAADEIERLREEVSAWKSVAQEMTMYAAIQELKAAADE
jgi:hypothetical protein